MTSSIGSEPRAAAECSEWFSHREAAESNYFRSAILEIEYFMLSEGCSTQ